MKLTELNPRWVAADERHGQGIVFDCPTCRDHVCGVNFDVPLDGGTPFAQGLWQRTGDTFETLTLSPSLLVRGSRDAGPCAHFFVRNGAIEMC